MAEDPLVLSEKQLVIRLVLEIRVSPLRQYDDAVEARILDLTRTEMQRVGIDLDSFALRDIESDDLLRIELSVLDIVELCRQQNEIGRSAVYL